MKLPWDKESRNGHASNEPVDPMRGTLEDRNLGDLEPGDAIELWGEGNKVVTTVYECSEKIGIRDYVWRWSFLDDGSIVEASMDGQWRYAEHQIVPQGSALYSDLVGPKGLLEVFEARVRDDSVGDNPLFIELRGKRYRITATGTVAPKRRGAAPKLAPWAQFVNTADENVYFSFVAEDDEEDGVLGVWTTHVCLSFGRPLGETDVEAVYRKR
jgi:hypothetical protein